MSTKKRVTSCLRFTGAAANTPSCVCASREPENMAARRPKMRWRSCAAWPVAGQTSISAHRVSSVRRVRGIHAYRSAEKDGEWLTLTEAAAALRVTSHMVRRLIKSSVLPAVQVVAGAPYQIRAEDLASESVKSAVARKGRPCRVDDTNTIPMFTD